MINGSAPMTNPSKERSELNVEGNELDQIHNAICNKIEELLSHLYEIMHMYKKNKDDILTKKIINDFIDFENGKKSREELIEDYQEGRPHIEYIPEDIGKIRKMRLKFYEKNMNIPVLATACYRKLCEMDLSGAIKLMGNYIQSTNNIDKKSRLDPIAKLLDEPRGITSFYENSSVLINEVLPIILEFGWIRDFQNMGVHFKIPTIEDSTSISPDLGYDLNYQTVQFSIRDMEIITVPIINEEAYTIIGNSYEQLNYPDEYIIDGLLKKYVEVLSGSVGIN